MRLDDEVSGQAACEGLSRAWWRRWRVRSRLAGKRNGQWEEQPVTAAGARESQIFARYCVLGGTNERRKSERRKVDCAKRQDSGRNSRLLRRRLEAPRYWLKTLLQALDSGGSAFLSGFPACFRAHPQRRRLSFERRRE